MSVQELTGLTEPGGDHLPSTTEAFPLGPVSFPREQPFHFLLGGRMAVVMEHGISQVANTLLANWRKGVKGPPVSM